ncbi:MAG: glycosyltransferase family 2 protein [Nitrospira sp.]
MIGISPATGNDSQVTIVVLTHNRSSEVLRTLDRLTRLTEPFPIILIDNGSVDGTATEVAARFPHVRVVALPRNIGAAARNVGIQAAMSPYVALCDDDTWWSEGSIRRALQVLERHPRVAIVTAKVLVGPEEREDPVCRLMAESPLPRPVGLPYPSLIGFLAGASLVRREAILSVGGFEPRFVIGGEEALLSYDLANAGWSMVYLPTATVHHHPSLARDSQQRRHLLKRNALWLLWLRRPLTSVLRESWRELTSPPVAHEFGAILQETLVQGKWLWSHRRVIRNELETQIRMLEQQRECPQRRDAARLPPSAHPSRSTR